MTVYYIPGQAEFEGIYREPEKEVSDDEDNEPSHVPCSRCGRETTFDSTYGDLCYRCCRAENE